MRPIKMPNGEQQSQEEVLRRITCAKGAACVAHVRVLLGYDDGAWIPACGRIDVARPEDAPIIKTRPVGGARIVTETISIDELTARLAAGFGGAPFVVAGEQIADHGMNSAWGGARYTDVWAEYGARWPVIELVPTGSLARQPYLFDTYEASGDAEALDGIMDCVRQGIGFATVNDVRDVRRQRFGVYVWDYRGVFRPKVMPGAVCFEIDPPGDSSLKLAMVVRHDAGLTSRTFETPAVVSVPVTGTLRRLNMTLRHGNDIVCELLWSESTERFRLEQDGVYFRPPVGPEADPIDAGSTVAELALPFMVDPSLARMVARDLAELDSVVRSATVKSAILLAGSILEAVLLDVLGRNDGEARRRLGKKWPERASAMDLIEAASSIAVLLPDATTRPLLPLLTGKKGALLVDHRDLIHPRAEIRGAATIDTNTVQTMQGVLGEVLRDLREAHAAGVLAEYGAGKVVSSAPPSADQ